MRALVKYGSADKQVELRDVPTPTVEPGTVLIRTRAVGVCGSDIHMWRNKQSWPVAEPVILGHEIAGEITEIGDGVTGWAVGDRVVSETAAFICGHCAYCRSGRYNLCPKRQGFGALRDGAFGEYLVVEPRILHHIPAELSFEEAAITEPFCVAYNAVVERARVSPGDTVAVQGVGAIGALCIQLALLQGAATTVAIGTASDRLRLQAVKHMGATHVIDLTSGDPLQIVASIGDGFGADVVVDATGVSAALNQSLELVRPLGVIAKVGWGPQPLDFSLDPLVAKAVTLHGAFSHTWSTWERVLSLLAVGRLDATSAIGGTYDLEDWQEAFERMESGENMKSVIRF